MVRKKFFIEKLFSVDYEQKLNYMLYTRDITCNMRRRNNGGNDMYKKDQ